MEVNYEYLRQLGYGTKEFIASRFDAYASDIEYGGAPMIVRPGMWLRLTRNLDKERGFVNEIARIYMGADEYPFDQPGDERATITIIAEQVSAPEIPLAEDAPGKPD